MPQMPYVVLAALSISLTVPGARIGQHDASLAAPEPATLTETLQSQRQVAGYGNLPIRFEPNVGQAPPQIAFSARAQGYLIAITERGATLRLQSTWPMDGGKPAAHVDRSSTSNQSALRLHPMYATARPRLVAERQLTSVSNYFIGNDPSKWHRNVANYGAIRYEQLYPGIDWVIYGNPGLLEYDFVVAPRSDPHRIKLRIEGADSLSLNGKGELLIKTKNQIVRQLKPVIYQTAADGTRQTIDGRYVLTDGKVGFAVGVYDRDRALIIDPAVAYSTYLGAGLASAIATDGDGNAYVVGSTFSTDFPTENPLQASNLERGFGTAFIAKLNAAGTALVYSTYLGGSGNGRSGNLGSCGAASSDNFGRGALITGNGGDGATAIAVDAGGNAYVAGFTSSSDFPTAAPLQAVNRATINHGSNAFVAKLNAAGNALVYSTYLGGSGIQGALITGDSAASIAVDGTGNAYVTGITMSRDFPTQGPFQAHNEERAGNVTGFVAKLNTQGSALVYSSYLGGSSGNAVTGAYDCANGIAVDAGGNVYIAGQTSATDFPTATAFQPVNRALGFAAAPSGATAFLSKVNASGSALTYSTYLGGSILDAALAVAVDMLGDAYVSGFTYSSDFPTANALQPQNATAGHGANAFVTKFDPAGNGLIYSTYLGGSIDDQSNAITVDAAGNAYVAGSTYSDDFPVVDPLQAQNNAASHKANNVFISVLDPSGSTMEFSTYLGGSGTEGYISCPVGDNPCPVVYNGDSAVAIAVDGLGNLYVTGLSQSTDFPLVSAFQTKPSGIFVTKIDVGKLGNAQGTGGGGALGLDFIGILGFVLATRWRSFRSARDKRQIPKM